MGQRATFALAGGGSADSGPNDRNGGRFAYNGGNETELDAYDDDAVMHRRGGTVRVNGGGGGADSWDSLPDGPGGRRVQMVMTHGEQSEQARGEPNNPMGSWKMQMNDGKGEADSNGKTVIAFEPITGPSKRPGHEGEILEAFQLGEPQWESLVRQLVARLGGSVSAGGSSNKIVSPDGRLELDIQNADAAGLVAYMDGKAIWSAQEGWKGLPQ
jgi:hypothetical protein